MAGTLDAEARRAIGILNAWLDGQKLEDLRTECRERGLDTAGIVPTLRNRLRAYFRDSGQLPEVVAQTMRENRIHENAIRRSFEITDDEDENLDETPDRNDTTVLGEHDNTEQRIETGGPTHIGEDKAEEQIRDPETGTGQLPGDGDTRRSAASTTGETGDLNPGSGPGHQPPHIPKDVPVFTSTPRPTETQTSQGAPTPQGGASLSLTELIRQEIAKAVAELNLAGPTTARNSGPRRQVAFDEQTQGIGIGAGFPRANSTVNQDHTATKFRLQTVKSRDVPQRSPPVSPSTHTHMSSRLSS